MKILAVDYGDSRTGLATCDRTEFLTSPITPQITLKARNKVAARVCEVAKEIGAELIVIGLPLNMDGSEGERAAVKCYGANDVLEGVAIMKAEGVDVSITGNSTNPTRFQHLVAGTYKKWANENGKKYFSVASGGGTGRTLHPDNMAAGPASYGLTDSMGRMHGDAQFAGSSSVPAHVEMMGLIGMGNNPMVGATVACAVAVYEGTKE